MAKAFLGPSAIDAFVGAGKSIESESSVEVVTSIRSRSGSYIHADLIVGACAGLATLAYLLFAPQVFGLVWFLVDPLVVGALFAWASSRLPYFRRWLTSTAVRDTRVRMAAEAIFFERGIHRTRQRTGLLVYVSLLEDRVFLLADSGIDSAVPRREWQAARERVQQAMASGRGLVVAEALTTLGPLLAHHLPRADDDVNELPDEVDA